MPYLPSGRNSCSTGTVPQSTIYIIRPIDKNILGNQREYSKDIDIHGFDFDSIVVEFAIKCIRIMQMQKTGHAQSKHNF
jgi:hypothetical protein